MLTLLAWADPIFGAFGVVGLLICVVSVIVEPMHGPVPDVHLLCRIPDPEASKPDDWDEDAPREILDDEAEKPEGWLDNEPEEVDDPGGDPCSSDHYLLSRAAITVKVLPSYFTLFICPAARHCLTSPVTLVLCLPTP